MGEGHVFKERERTDEASLTWVSSKGFIQISECHHFLISISSLSRQNNGQSRQGSDTMLERLKRFEHPVLVMTYDRLAGEKY